MKKVFFFVIFLLLVGSIGVFLRLRTASNKQDVDIPSALKSAVTAVHEAIGGKNSQQNSIKHVFVIVEENKDWSSIAKNVQAPYINSLLQNGAYAQNYHNIATNLGDMHPSELNYIFMESGQVAFSDHVFTTDNDPSADNSTASVNHVTSLLEKNGYTWKSYQEGISGTNCPIQTQDLYAPRHNPFLYFQDVSGNPPSTSSSYCIQHIRPLSELEHDLQSNTIPNYVFITPNLQNDMHSGTISQADTWLSQIVPKITNSQTFQKDGALFITWDEGSDNSDGNNPIGMIILSPFAKKGYTNTTAYSHASLLKTIEEIFKLQPLLGEAGNPKTQDLSAFFQ